MISKYYKIMYSYAIVIKDPIEITLLTAINIIQSLEITQIEFP